MSASSSSSSSPIVLTRSGFLAASLKTIFFWVSTILTWGDFEEPENAAFQVWRHFSDKGVFSTGDATSLTWGFIEKEDMTSASDSSLAFCFLFPFLFLVLSLMSSPNILLVMDLETLLSFLIKWKNTPPGDLLRDWLLVLSPPADSTSRVWAKILLTMGSPRTVIDFMMRSTRGSFNAVAISITSELVIACFFSFFFFDWLRPSDFLSISLTGFLIFLVDFLFPGRGSLWPSRSYLGFCLRQSLGITKVSTSLSMTTSLFVLFFFLDFLVTRCPPFTLVRETELFIPSVSSWSMRTSLQMLNLLFSGVAFTPKDDSGEVSTSMTTIEVIGRLWSKCRWQSKTTNVEENTWRDWRIVKMEQQSRCSSRRQADFSRSTCSLFSSSRLSTFGSFRQQLPQQPSPLSSGTTVIHKISRHLLQTFFSKQKTRDTGQRLKEGERFSLPNLERMILLESVRRSLHVILFLTWVSTLHHLIHQNYYYYYQSLDSDIVCLSINIFSIS